MTQEIAILSQYIEDNGKKGNRWEIVCSSFGLGDAEVENKDKTDLYVGTIAELEKNIRDNFYIISLNRPNIQVNFNAISNFPAQCQVSIANPPREFMQNIYARRFIIYIGYAFMVNGKEQLWLEPIFEGQSVMPSRVIESGNTTEFTLQMSLGRQGFEQKTSNIASANLDIRNRKLKDIILEVLGKNIEFSTDPVTEELLKADIKWNPILNTYLDFNSFRDLLRKTHKLIIDNMNGVIAINTCIELKTKEKKSGENYATIAIENPMKKHDFQPVKKGCAVLWNGINDVPPFFTTTCLRSKVAYVDESLRCNIQLAFVMPQLTKYLYCVIQNVGVNIDIMSVYKIDGYTNTDRKGKNLQFYIYQNTINFDTMGNVNTHSLALLCPQVVKDLPED